MQRGADGDTMSIHGATPLMLAARDGHTEVVERLLADGCSLTIKDKNGFRALDHARIRKQSDIVKLLTVAGPKA